MTATKTARELKVGDIVRSPGSDQFDTVFEIEVEQRDIFGIIDYQAFVGLTDLDCFVACAPDTPWEIMGS
jgi:hypothetical protein